MSGTDIVALAVSVTICFAAAAIGGYATTRSLRDWYVALPKPAWNPPSWLFGPVWTLLYVMMAVAAWLVWRGRESSDVRPLLLGFAIQLVLNVLWSVVFFGLRSPGGGLAVIILLWWAMFATIIGFAPVAPTAAALLVPYLLWVTFATALNGAIAGKVAQAARR